MAVVSSLHRVGQTAVSQGFCFEGSPHTGPLMPPTWQAAMLASMGWSMDPDLSTRSMRLGLLGVACTSTAVAVWRTESGATGSKS